MAHGGKVAIRKGTALKTLILTLQDDGCVHAYQSIEEAVSDIEPEGAADGIIRAAFDQRGIPYAVHWLEPPARRSFLRVFSVSTKGRFTLVASGPPDPTAAAKMLEGAPAVFPEELRDRVAEVRAMLAVGS
jgi:hypothetical protein